MEASPERKRVKSTIKRFILIASLIGMGAVFMFLSVRNWVAGARPSPEERIVEEVAGKISVPDNVPNLQMVEEAELLRSINPNVYAEVENGDAMLEYDKKIILYRPSSKEIIRIIEK